MPRLTDPAKGTVVHCGDDLAVHFMSQGWTDAEAKVEQVKATPEKPATTRRRSK